MIDIEAKHMAIVVKILHEQVPGCEVRAFGSRVKNRAKPYSDLDLAILSNEKLGIIRLGQIIEAFQESELPFRVDVLDWFSISEEFQKVIEEKFEVIEGV